ncbi:hypothetical protein RND81_01G215800 [Saponaria officinalis]|uniref:Chitin-binding type-1 domain-containing protein n=1 Tax=Saponaria officinalis TaxID=3572 RepID=A0AAW1NHI2_SAPOF
MVNMKSCALLMILITMPYLMGMTSAAQCGRQAGGRRCSGGLCCSKYGFCGTTNEYCGAGNCQSQCLLDVPNQTQTQAQVQQGRPEVEGAGAGAP